MQLGVEFDLIAPFDMASRLLNIIMRDGSRYFGDLPASVLWYEARDHVEKLEGANLTGFITDHITEAWIDFPFSGHKFSINDQFGDYWFFVDDPNAPDEILEKVLAHFRALLGEERPTTPSKVAG